MTPAWNICFAAHNVQQLLAASPSNFCYKNPTSKHPNQSPAASKQPWAPPGRVLYPEVRKSPQFANGKQWFWWLEPTCDWKNLTGFWFPKHIPNSHLNWGCLRHKRCIGCILLSRDKALWVRHSQQQRLPNKDERKCAGQLQHCVQSERFNSYYLWFEQSPYLICTPLWVVIHLGWKQPTQLSPKCIQKAIKESPKTSETFRKTQNSCSLTVNMSL